MLCLHLGLLISEAIAFFSLVFHSVIYKSLLDVATNYRHNFLGTFLEAGPIITDMGRQTV